MRFATVCSGIGAPECAWEPLGWEPVFCSEIDPFPSAVLAHRFPSVPNLGDFTKIGAVDAVDLLCAGTPCQSFSVAGRRGGMDDPRGVLAFEFLRLAGRLRPRWLVFENVPGLLSSDSGEDFHAFLGSLAGLGYGFAYRVLDAQWFGVAQRRARVFVVGCLGDWRGPVAVLFEPEGLRGDPAPSREAGTGVAGTLEARAGTGGHDPGAHGAASGHLVAAQCHGGNVGPMGTLRRGNGDTTGGVPFVAAPIKCRMRGATDEVMDNLIAHTLKAEGADASEDGTGRGVPLAVVQDSQSGVRLQDKSGALRADAPGSQPGGSLLLVPDCAATLTQGVDSQGKGGYAGRRREDDENLVACSAPDGTVTALCARDAKSHKHGDGLVLGFHARQTPVHANGTSLAKGGQAVAYTVRDERGRMNEGYDTERASPLHAAKGPSEQQAVASGRGAVRRLTPRECERLQGFPDDWTLVPYRGKEAKDGPRYRAIGNSMAVPVMRWIGERIAMWERLAPPPSSFPSLREEPSP